MPIRGAASTVTVVVDELLPGVVSWTSGGKPMVAVLGIGLGGVVGGIDATMVKVAFPPASRLTFVSSGPLPPAELQDEPVVAVQTQVGSETTAGNVSWTRTLDATPGPLLVTTMLPPHLAAGRHASTEAAVFTTPTSAI